jgi:tetratricopeptide (TPR) repeat protein
MDEIKKLSQQAIEAALANHWQKAIELNERIIKLDSQNIAALNRLTKSYLELGKKKEARVAIKKVLELDKFNPLALKNLQKINLSKPREAIPATPTDPDLFIEEPGKTKTVSLINLADKSIINKLAVGETVNLVPRERRVSVISQSGDNLGKLPDDVSLRLKSLIKGGNQYQAYIRSTSDGVKVFIQEVFRSKKLANQPSFVSHEEDYLSFTPPNLVHEGPPELPSEEETEEG